MPQKTAFLTAALAALLVLATAGTASADTLCVGAGPSGCTAEPDLQTALNTAMSHSGPDTVTLAPGTYTPAGGCAGGGFTASAPSGNGLSLVGSGAAATKLTCPANYDNTGGRAILDLSGGATVSGLEIHMPAGNNDIGLKLFNSTADSVVVTGDAAATNVDGAILNGGTLTNSSVSYGSAQDTGEAVQAENGAVLDADVLGGGFIGLEVGAPGIVSATHLRVAARLAVWSNEAQLTLQDSTLWATHGSGTGNPTGIQASAGLGANSNVTARHVSIGTVEANGIGIWATAAGSGAVQTINLTDSAIGGFAIPVERYAHNSGTANVSTSYADYPATGNSSSGPGSLSESHVLHDDPAFANPATGDLHIGPSSPLVDAGTPGSLGAEPNTDLDGNPRILSGRGSCTDYRRDIGAYEYVAPLPATASGAPASGQGGLAAAFHATGCSIEPAAAAPVFSWAFDDGTTATGPDVVHSFPTPGVHHGTVTVTDADGHTGTATATVTLAVATTTTTTTTTSTTVTHTTRPPETPVISRLRLAPARVHVRQPPRGRRLKLGTTIGWTDTLAARTTLTVTANAPGIASGKRCIPVPRHPRGHAHRCPRAVTLGALTHHDRAGTNTLVFNGRLRGHVLAAGNYRLTLVAHLSGRTSPPASATFTVTR